MAPRALIQVAGLDYAIAATTAARALKAGRPACLKQRFGALKFGTVSFHEIRQTEAFLKLDRILFRGTISCQFMAFIGLSGCLEVAESSGESGTFKIILNPCCRLFDASD